MLDKILDALAAFHPPEEGDPLVHYATGEAQEGVQLRTKWRPPYARLNPHSRVDKPPLEMLLFVIQQMVEDKMFVRAIAPDYVLLGYFTESAKKLRQLKNQKKEPHLSSGFRLVYGFPENMFPLIEFFHHFAFIRTGQREPAGWHQPIFQWGKEVFNVERYPAYFRTGPHVIRSSTSISERGYHGALMTMIERRKVDLAWPQPVPLESMNPYWGFNWADLIDVISFLDRRLSDRAPSQ